MIGSVDEPDAAAWSSRSVPCVCACRAVDCDQGDLLLGLGCAIMFGGGVAIFGLQILDSYREQEAALIDGEVRLPPSVPIHESPLRPRIAMAVMGCFGLGAVLVGIDRQPLLLLIGAALCVLTLVFPFFKAKGYLTSRIVFSPQGFTSSNASAAI